MDPNENQKSKSSEKLHEKLPKELHEKLSDLQKKIISSMLEDPKVTYEQLITITGKSREAIRKNINKLKEKKLIQRIGPDKGGYWQVMNHEKHER